MVTCTFQNQSGGGVYTEVPEFSKINGKKKPDKATNNGIVTY
jgi:hypothetical protein